MHPLPTSKRTSVETDNQPGLNWIAKFTLLTAIGMLLFVDAHAFAFAFMVNFVITITMYAMVSPLLLLLTLGAWRLRMSPEGSRNAQIRDRLLAAVSLIAAVVIVTSIIISLAWGYLR